MPSSTEIDATAVAPVRGKRTQATQLLSRLRTDIVWGRLMPGERLVVSSLSEAYDAGQTPVREALMRLASEGFVTFEDQRGFSVAPVSRSELVDLTAARADIDALTLRAAIQHGDDAWEATLIGAWHRLQKMRKIRADGVTIDPEWEQRHAAFHDALTGACPNEVMLQIRAMLYQRADRYRRLSVRYLKAPRDDRAEHEALFKATLARNTELAEALLKEHIHTTSRILLDEVDDIATVSDAAAGQSGKAG